MRKQHRSAWSSLFASKRIVVALCAAVAMVIGAMSVGAYTPKPDETESYPLPAANQSSVVTQLDSRQAPSRQLRKEFAVRHRLAPLSPEQSAATQKIIAPSQLTNMQLALNLNPVKADQDIPSVLEQPLLGDDDTPATAPDPVPTPLSEPSPQGDAPETTESTPSTPTETENLSEVQTPLP